MARNPLINNHKHEKLISQILEKHFGPSHQKLASVARDPFCGLFIDGDVMAFLIYFVLPEEMAESVLEQQKSAK